MDKETNGLKVATCAKISLVSRTHARISHLCMRVIYIVAIIIYHHGNQHHQHHCQHLHHHVGTCLVQFRDSWVGLAVEQRGRQMQVGANLSIKIITINVLNIIIIIIVLNIFIIIRNHCPQYH